jgi:hypothetical protein
MIKSVCIFISLFFSGIVSAQQDSSMLRPKNLIYAEAGGNAIGYSINYTRIFFNYVCLRGGVEMLPLKEGAEYQFPVEGSFLIGNKRHFLELGIGFTIYSHIISPPISPGGASMGITPHSERISGLNGCARIGYCFMPLRKKNLLFRIAFTPLFLNRYIDGGYYDHNEIWPWGGVSIGYAF